MTGTPWKDYLVYTEEKVVRRYVVKAQSENHARKRFNENTFVAELPTEVWYGNEELRKIMKKEVSKKGE